MSRVFSSVLVANRGEIALRVMRTLRRLGICAIAGYSDADRLAPHVEFADIAVRLGPTPARESYLSIDRVIAAALATGAQAVHPGYGFLSENPDFAAACEAAGIVFIGPTPGVIRAMGDKRAAKDSVGALGVPVIPGFQALGASDADLVAAAPTVGFPLIVKPAAGGGGKGMKVVAAAVDLPDALASARREARAAFNDDSLLLEHYLVSARHVEVQVFGDGNGGVIHLGDRDCSLQRRHQKVIEEAPAPFLGDDLRGAIHSAAVRVAESVGYRGAGTVEFMVDATEPASYYFLEVNTRLQVEHPVTEAVTGLDLVELQLRIAAGDGLGLTQDDIRISGHAVEARVYAEDGHRAFLPSSGTVLAYREPVGVRVDSGVVLGTAVGTSYDPLILKVIAAGEDREVAFRTLERALGELTVLGLAHNVSVLRALVTDPTVLAGRMTTSLIGHQHFGDTADQTDDHQLAAAALAWQLSHHDSGPWYAQPGWRIGDRAEVTTQVSDESGRTHVVVTTGLPASGTVRIDHGAACEVAATPALGRPGSLVVEIDGITRTYDVALDPVDDGVWLGHGGDSWLFRQRQRTGRHVVDGGGPASGELRSPMPGSVVIIVRAAGDPVARGEVIAVVEAMKMEYPLTAPYEGIVESVAVTVGAQVARDQLIATIASQVTE